MVVGNRSLEMIQGWTQSRAELLAGLAQVAPDIPYKEMTAGFWTERIGQSLDALQQIAIENTGVPGRKSIVWLGHGAPSLMLADLPEQNKRVVEAYIHSTVNLMVMARTSLFLIFPGLPPAEWTSAPTGRAVQLEQSQLVRGTGGHRSFCGQHQLRAVRQ